MHHLSGLIGGSGFVGSNLLSQHPFDKTYGRSNIHEIEGKKFGLMVCAAPSAVKWKANQDPEADEREVDSLIKSLASVSAEYFVLISTVDVYPDPQGVDETSPIDPKKGDAYGRNRRKLSDFVEGHFPDHLILRLPGLYGKGLKKNCIFDLMTTGQSPWTDADSEFQWYGISRLWGDIEIARRQGISLLNMASEPLSVRELSEACFDSHFTNKTEKPPVRYDMQSIHAQDFGSAGRYLFTKEQVIKDLKAFVDSERRAI